MTCVVCGRPEREHDWRFGNGFICPIFGELLWTIRSDTMGIGRRTVTA